MKSSKKKVSFLQVNPFPSTLGVFGVLKDIKSHLDSERHSSVSKISVERNSDSIFIEFPPSPTNRSAFIQGSGDSEIKLSLEDKSSSTENQTVEIPPTSFKTDPKQQNSSLDQAGRFILGIMTKLPPTGNLEEEDSC
ncbi:MAG: hypothetical protein ACFFBD_07530 [Candidatus Hodarchaeota archaeon]